MFKLVELLNYYNKISGLDHQSKKLIQDIIYETEVTKHLQKYANCIDKSERTSSKSSQKRKIWQLWYQGIENEPDIVKYCMESVNKYADDRERIILTKNNIEHYVNLPGYIYDKKKSGIITNVNFSDILRSCLLAEHGGTWMDATVLLTDSIPEYILNAPLFCFSTTPIELRGIGKILASSWFIHSEPNYIFKYVKDMLFEFWKHELNCRHHYYFHLFFSIAVNSFEICRQEWQVVPFFSNVPPHILQIELFNQYSQERYMQIKSMSSIHKLTFYGGEEFDTSIKGTFYDHLINSN